MYAIIHPALATMLVPIGLAVRCLYRNLRRRRMMARPLPGGWIEFLTRHIALYRALPANLKPQLHGHIQNFLAEKHFEGCGGLALTEAMQRHHPDLYEELKSYYRLDPAVWKTATISS